MARSPSSRKAIVTGGARRVGRAIVERLASNGFDVTFTFLSSEPESNEVARSTGATAIKADLTDPTAAAKSIAAATAHWSSLDLLVHNASLYERASLSDVTLETSRRLMAIHYESPLLLTQALASKLRAASTGGRVITMLDLQIERPVPAYLAYCASKAALANLTLSLARELAPDVTVNGIAPGVVQWPEDFPPAQQENYLRRVPLGRPGNATDVAELVHFLATEGSYLTGQIIRLDGGRSIT